MQKLRLMRKQLERESSELQLAFERANNIPPPILPADLLLWRGSQQMLDIRDAFRAINLRHLRLSQMYV